MGGAIDYSGATCLGIHDTTPTAGPAPKPEFEAVEFGSAHTFTTAGGVFAVRGRDGAVAGKKKGTGNSGNGVGNTGPGNQGNDKDVGNAGGAKGKAAASGSDSASASGSGSKSASGSGSKSASGSASASGEKVSGSDSGSGSKSASGSDSKSASGSDSKSASGSGSKSGSSSSSEEKPFVLPTSSLWAGITNGCRPATGVVTARPVAHVAGSIVNPAEEFANLAVVGEVRQALGDVNIRVAAAPTVLAGTVGFVNPQGKLELLTDVAGTVSGTMRVTTTFMFDAPLYEVSQTVEVPFEVTVEGFAAADSGLGGSGGLFGGGLTFARQAGVAEVATAQPTPAMWMAFMGACMSVMLVSVVILAWFAYAVVGARAAVPAAKYVAVEPRFAASA